MKNKHQTNLILKFWICCVFLLAAACTSNASPDQPLRILFIGNSYTFANQMPDTLAEMAKMGGHDVVVESLAKGGYSLSDHISDEATRSMLIGQAWDVVVLQEKSSFPVSAEERQEKMLPAIREIDELVASQSGETILFMPWAYRDGFPEPGLDEYSLMQAEVENAYLEIGGELDLSVAPVGIVWKEVLEQEPQLQLWDPDGSHPSPAGSFLAASVFYTVIFDNGPADLNYTPTSINEEIGQLITGIIAENSKLWDEP